MKIIVLLLCSFYLTTSVASQASSANVAATAAVSSSSDDQSEIKKFAIIEILPDLSKTSVGSDTVTSTSHEESGGSATSLSAKLDENKENTASKDYYDGCFGNGRIFRVLDESKVNKQAYWSSEDTDVDMSWHFKQEEMLERMRDYLMNYLKGFNASVRNRNFLTVQMEFEVREVTEQKEEECPEIYPCNAFCNVFSAFFGTPSSSHENFSTSNRHSYGINIPFVFFSGGKNEFKKIYNEGSAKDVLSELRNAQNLSKLNKGPRFFLEKIISNRGKDPKCEKELAKFFENTYSDDELYEKTQFIDFETAIKQSFGDQNTKPFFAEVEDAETAKDTAKDFDKLFLRAIVHSYFCSSPVYSLEQIMFTKKRGKIEKKERPDFLKKLIKFMNEEDISNGLMFSLFGESKDIFTEEEKASKNTKDVPTSATKSDKICQDSSVCAISILLPEEAPLSGLDETQRIDFDRCFHQSEQCFLKAFFLDAIKLSDNLVKLIEDNFIKKGYRHILHKYSLSSADNFAKFDQSSSMQDSKTPSIALSEVEYNIPEEIKFVGYVTLPIDIARMHIASLRPICKFCRGTLHHIHPRLIDHLISLVADREIDITKNPNVLDFNEIESDISEKKDPVYNLAKGDTEKLLKNNDRLKCVGKTIKTIYNASKQKVLKFKLEISKFVIYASSSYYHDGAEWLMGKQ